MKPNLFYASLIYKLGRALRRPLLESMRLPQSLRVPNSEGIL